MHIFKEKINRRIYFKFPKEIIDKHWRELSKCAKAVYPVIAVHLDKQGFCFLSDKTIEILTGYSEKPVRDAIKELSERQLFRVKKERNHREYFREPVKRKPSFEFYKWIIDTGLWRKISHSAQAVYPVMRSLKENFNILYYNAHCDDTNRYFSNETNRNSFKKREFDLCIASGAYICELAGISRNSFLPAIKNLIEYNLVQIRYKIIDECYDLAEYSEDDDCLLDNDVESINYSDDFIYKIYL